MEDLISQKKLLERDLKIMDLERQLNLLKKQLNNG
jgi:hypothetical protein